MPGKVFVTALLCFMLLFILLVVLFNFYPPAANSWWTALGVAVYVVASVLIVRRVARP